MGIYTKDGGYMPGPEDYKSRIQPETIDPYVRTELNSEIEERQKIQD